MTPPPTPSTQSHIDIADISDDLVILKDGSACLLIEVAAVNFGLFSEKEQEATIYAYGQLLNSLNFTIQIVVISKRKDISEYIGAIEHQLQTVSSPPIRAQISKYLEFVQAVVRQGNVLDKKFYISIPFSSSELGLGSTLTNLVGKKTPTQLPTTTIVDRAVTSLLPKRDHLLRLLIRIGLKAHQLTSQELLQFFFDIYNPDQIGARVTLPQNTPPSTLPPI